MAQTSPENDTLEFLRETLSAKHLSGPNEVVDAVVALLLREETPSDPSVLLIHRAERADDPWSGQIGFPGGRVSHSDASPRAALKREVKEEVGVNLDDTGTELGTLSIGSPMRVLNMKVQPWVYGMTLTPRITIGPEVQEAFWIEISRLPSVRITTEIQIRGIQRPVDAFLVDGHVVWGYTHRVLNELLSILDHTF